MSPSPFVPTITAVLLGLVLTRKKPEFVLVKNADCQQVMGCISVRMYILLISTK